VLETDERDDVCRLGGELVGQFLVVRNQMGNIDIAVVLLDENVLA
jgi:hypothetical protein